MRRTIHKRIAAFVLLAGACTLDAGDLTELERLVDRWTAVRETTAAEARDWDELAATWRHEISLLTRERDTLTAQVERETAARRETAEALAELDAAIAGDDAILRELIDSVAAMEAHLREMRRFVPAALAPELADELAALDGDASPIESRTLVNRMQRALGLMADMERFQNALHTGLDTLEIDGIRREFRVLYLGMGRAYGVAPDGTRATVGVPDDDGWTWQYADDLAADVAAAIAILGRETPARLVRLPMQVRP